MPSPADKTPRQLWIEALRSGKYRQGVGVLHRTFPDGEGTASLYCCLGVACDLYAQTHQIEISEQRPGIIRYEMVEGYLPWKVQEWLGLRTHAGAYGSGDAETTLATHNDSGDSFSEIADIIKAEPEGLFR